jgi:hypothetical protein
LPADPGKRYWFRAEMLLWFIEPFNTPPLLTTATPPNFGFLGGPTTQILLGNGSVQDPFGPGARFSAGMWLDCCQTWGLDADYFFFVPPATLSRFDSSQFPVLTRPFFAPNGPIQFGELVAFPPGIVPGVQGQAGTFLATASSFLQGAELNLKRAFCPRCWHDWGYRWDVFGGGRFLDLAEDLRMEEDVTFITPNPNFAFDIAGTRVVVVDQFSTRNQFYGGQVGAHLEMRKDRWFAEMRASIAIGDTHETLTINGSQVHTQPGGATVTDVGGLLAINGTNIGTFSRDHFAFVPELRLNIGYQVTPSLRAFLGYNFMYWNSVIRPGTEIDTIVDVARIPHPPAGVVPVFPPRPMPLFNQVDVWAQGANICFEIKW